MGWLDRSVRETLEHVFRIYIVIATTMFTCVLCCALIYAVYHLLKVW
jgi:hypothetical protein